MWRLLNSSWCYDIAKYVIQHKTEMLSYPIQGLKQILVYSYEFPIGKDKHFGQYFFIIYKKVAWLKSRQCVTYTALHHKYYLCRLNKKVFVRVSYQSKFCWPKFSPALIFSLGPLKYFDRYFLNFCYEYKSIDVERRRSIRAILAVDRL